MQKEQEENNQADNRPPDNPTTIHVVTKQRTRIPLDFIFIVVLLAISFYFGLKIGSGALEKAIDVGKEASDLHKEEMKKVKEKNEQVVAELNNRLDVIKQNYNKEIESAEYENQNSREKAEEFTRLVDQTLSEIASVNSKMGSAGAGEKVNLQADLQRLEKLLENYRINRLVYLCKKIPIYEVPAQ